MIKQDNTDNYLNTLAIAALRSHAHCLPAGVGLITLVEQHSGWETNPVQHDFKVLNHKKMSKNSQKYSVFAGEFTFKTLKHVVRGALRKHGRVFV